MHTVKSALLTGTGISILGVIILYLFIPSGSFDLVNTCCEFDFARRYDGTCGGWTTSLALFHVTGDLMHWWAYTTAAAILFQLHPIMAKVPSSRTAVYLMVAFIFGCGLTHLMEAYATFHPVYVFTGWFKFINAIISCVGAYFIAHALVRAFKEVKRQRDRLENLNK